MMALPKVNSEGSHMIIKRVSFISVFITAHILFVVAQIHKHSTIAELSYEQQKNQKTLSDLTEKKQQLTNTLHALHNRQTTQEFVQAHLGMRPVKLSQVKNLKDIFHDRTI